MFHIPPELDILVTHVILPLKGVARQKIDDIKRQPLGRATGMAIARVMIAKSQDRGLNTTDLRAILDAVEFEPEKEESSGNG